MTMTDCVTRLAEARAALHKLQIGGAIAEVRHGDQVLRYSASDLGSLQTYVRTLEAECGGCNGTAKPRRPFGVIW
jgi:hypothetical protein